MYHLLSGRHPGPHARKPSIRLPPSLPGREIIRTRVAQDTCMQVCRRVCITYYPKLLGEAGIAQVKKDGEGVAAWLAGWLAGWRESVHMSEGNGGIKGWREGAEARRLRLDGLGITWTRQGLRWGAIFRVMARRDVNAAEVRRLGAPCLLAIVLASRIATERRRSYAGGERGGPSQANPAGAYASRVVAAETARTTSGITQGWRVGGRTGAVWWLPAPSQSKAKQSKAKQSKAKQSKAKQSKAKEGKEVPAQRKERADLRGRLHRQSPASRPPAPPHQPCSSPNHRRRPLPADKVRVASALILQLRSPSMLSVCSLRARPLSTHCLLSTASVFPWKVGRMEERERERERDREGGVAHAAGTRASSPSSPSSLVQSVQSVQSVHGIHSQPGLPDSAGQPAPESRSYDSAPTIRFFTGLRRQNGETIGILRLQQGQASGESTGHWPGSTSHAGRTGLRVGREQKDQESAPIGAPRGELENPKA
ncbi:hypothetical protein BO71DRAFT_408597 [Aspergillus ellipticus CBS 707.79]|uniref:Uncharacterized protein n=1 Tax=Aspergillus ellipticus CBS 707.79 TaxID=1448320 RepID=A0A319DD98_9EURO|nr:hypothetical protein BO71DRAFT_408597 [Aspergillus ellipticus CBS 707.79]